MARTYRGWWQLAVGIGFAASGISKIVAIPPLRRLGAALLTSTSVCLALAELRHHDDKLVTPRVAMLLAAVTAGV